MLRFVSATSLLPATRSFVFLLKPARRRRADRFTCLLYQKKNPTEVGGYLCTSRLFEWAQQSGGTVTARTRGLGAIHGNWQSS
jgi:hypothetical protein